MAGDLQSKLDWNGLVLLKPKPFTRFHNVSQGRISLVHAHAKGNGCDDDRSLPSPWCPQMLQGAQPHRFPMSTLRASLPTLLPGVSAQNQRPPERLWKKRNGARGTKSIDSKLASSEGPNTQIQCKASQSHAISFPCGVLFYNSCLLVFPVHSVHSAIK